MAIEPTWREASPATRGRPAAPTNGLWLGSRRVARTGSQRWLLRVMIGGVVAMIVVGLSLFAPDEFDFVDPAASAFAGPLLLAAAAYAAASPLAGQAAICPLLIGGLGLAPGAPFIVIAGPFIPLTLITGFLVAMAGLNRHPRDAAALVLVSLVASVVLVAMNQAMVAEVYLAMAVLAALAAAAGFEARSRPIGSRPSPARFQGS